MKRDRIKTLLLAEALICALLALALWLFEGWRSRCMPR